MTPQPDKFFRDNLLTSRQTPPSQAWGRVQKGLQSNTKKLVWWSAAASVLIISVTSLLLTMHHPASTAISTDEERTTSEEAIVHSDTLSKIKTQFYSSNTIVTENVRQSGSTKSKSVTSIVASPNQSMPVDLTEHEMEIHPNALIVDTPVLEPEQEVNAITSSDEKIVVAQSGKIVYTASQVNARFLKKNSIPLLDTLEKNPSDLRRIMDIAYELKTETAFADLRQMKNNFISHPFKAQPKVK